MQEQKQEHESLHPLLESVQYKLLESLHPLLESVQYKQLESLHPLLESVQYKHNINKNYRYYSQDYNTKLVMPSW